MRPASALDRLNNAGTSAMANPSSPRVIGEGSTGSIPRSQQQPSGVSSSSSASTTTKKPADSSYQPKPSSSVLTTGTASSSITPSYYNASTIRPPSTSSTLPSSATTTSPTITYQEWQSKSIISVLAVTDQVLHSELESGSESKLVGIEMVDTLLIGMLSIERSTVTGSAKEAKEGSAVTLTIFEYLTGCWKRLSRVGREVGRLVRRFHRSVFPLVTLGLWRVGRDTCGWI
jgi:hypothetical protein